MGKTPTIKSGGGRIFIIRGFAVGELLRCGHAACRMPRRDAISNMDFRGLGGLVQRFLSPNGMPPWGVTPVVRIAISTPIYGKVLLILCHQDFVLQGNDTHITTTTFGAWANAKPGTTTSRQLEPCQRIER